MNKRINWHGWQPAWTWRAMDVLALLIGGEFSARLCWPGGWTAAAPVHTIVLYFCCALALLLLPPAAAGGGAGHDALPLMLGRLAAAWAATLLGGVAYALLLRGVGPLSPRWLACWFGTGLALLAASRLLLHTARHYLGQRGGHRRRVVLVGYGTVGSTLHQRTLRQPWCGYDVRAILAEPDDTGGPAARLAAFDELAPFVAAQAIDEIWITLPLGASAQLLQLHGLALAGHVALRWMPDTSGIERAGRLVDLLGWPAISLADAAPPRPGAAGKDMFDRLFALAALVALAPLLLLIALAVVASSPGPVLFRQRRDGLHGRPFTLYKFRSMRVHQEHGTLTQACRGDPRLSPIGHFLRRTSLDELPQFFNVLRGDMSVVGPRPHALLHNAYYEAQLASYALRHRVKPGITGWAQMHGHRGATDTVDQMARRVDYDLYYIEHWSFWLDVRIICWTALRGWTDRHAY